MNGLNALWPSASVMGQSIRKQIRQWVGLPVCVGIGSTKTLAKLANHMAKKQPGFNGVCDLESMPSRQIDALLSHIEVREVWGVGSQISLKLNADGIHTVRALRDTPPVWLRSKFGVVMERTGNELRGISCLALEEITPPRKQIISSRSFGQLVYTLPQLSESVASYVSSAAEKLRGQHSICNAVQVFVTTNPFSEQDPQYSNSITIPLPNASSDTSLLARAALFGLQHIYRPGFAYKKTGVMLTGISSTTMSQGSLCTEYGADEKSAKLMATLDQLNRRYGRNTVSVYSASNQKPWTMRRGNMSPCYTTSWHDVPIAYA